MTYYVLVYECLHAIVMLTYDHPWSYCIIIACQQCLIKRNPLRLKNDFKLIKIEPYAYSSFDKKPEVVENDNDNTCLSS